MINKKALIDLFETQVNSNTSRLEEKYYEGVDCPSMRFNSDFEPSDTFKTTYDDCEMFLFVNTKEEFFLFFNSISVKITFAEFKRLKNMFNKQKKIFLKRICNTKYKNDKKLLDKVFSNKNVRESRKTLVEKSNIKNLEDINSKLKAAY